MQHIKERLQEHIFNYIWVHYGKEKIYSEKDIRQAIEDDDTCTELKDLLWDLFYHELPITKVFRQIEEKKRDEEEEEEEEESDSETEDEDD